MLNEAETRIKHSRHFDQNGGKRLKEKWWKRVLNRRGMRWKWGGEWLKKEIMNKGQTGEDRSWQGEKVGAQRRDSHADMQLDEYKAPVSALYVCERVCSEHYCSTEARSSWYLEWVCTQLLHTDLTLILTGLNWLGNAGQHIRDREVRGKKIKGQKRGKWDKRGKRGKMGNDTGDGDGEKDLLLEQGVRGHPDTWIHLQRQESIHVRIHSTIWKDHSRKPEDSNFITNYEWMGIKNNYFTGIWTVCCQFENPKDVENGVKRIV